jgi:hypothetical protein
VRFKGRPIYLGKGNLGPREGRIVDTVQVMGRMQAMQEEGHHTQVCEERG